MLTVHELQCSFADVVFKKYQQELYSLSACKDGYKEGEVEEQKLIMGLLQSGVDCPTKKRKIHAALHVSPPATIVTATPDIVVFQFIQINPAGTWVIPHNLGYNPIVKVFDTLGNPIPGLIKYLDTNTLQIIFTTIIGGRANLYNQ